MRVFNTFLDEGVHQKIRDLTNLKAIDAIERKLLHYGVKLHYCKFSYNGKISTFDLPAYSDISIIVSPKRDSFIVYLFVDIDDRHVFCIDQYGNIEGIDTEGVEFKGHLFTLESYGYDARNSVILRDRKSLDKDSMPKSFSSDTDIDDIINVEKCLKSTIAKIDALDVSRISEMLMNCQFNKSSIGITTIKNLENFQQRLKKLCDVIENCKQNLITYRNF